MSLPENSIDLTPEQKAKVLDLLEKHLPDTEVWAYGSRVKWTSKPESDLDLVAFTPPEQKAAVAELREAFEESSLPFRVDFFEWDEVPESFREQIKEKYVVVRERDGCAGDESGISPTKLGEVARMVTERISTKGLDLNTYISTENMLPNRGGIVSPSNIPDQNVTAFKKGDTLFSNIRTYFRKVWLADRNGGASPDVIVFRTKNPDSLDGIYLHYLICSERFIEYTVLTAKGAKMPRGDKDAINIYEFDKIDIQSQRKAGQFLKTLDDKIALNRKLNETLEEMARALFQSWFVDFDPVKAKLAAVRHGRDPEKACMAALSGKLRIPAGKPTPERLDDQLPSAEDLDSAIAALDELSPEQQEKLARTAAHFPSDFADSELGLIPEGWEVKRIADICSLNAKSWNGKKHPEHINYVDLANCKNGYILSTSEYSWKDTPSRARRVLRSGDTIVGTVRPGNRSFALVGMTEGNLTGSTGFAVISPKENFLREFIYLHACGDENISRLQQLADGAAYPAVRPDVVVDYTVVSPTKAVIQDFSSETASLFDKRHVNEHQSRTLADLRDTLLPKLLSGELSLNEATHNQEACIP
ncbi:MAG: restriction endonuclease subunit S [Verrucomicrobia bacterium]|nr:restriction endonuclease subunit S [Verrucomicrobiota bacterium]MCH8528816.1 restriction endonuclease subunit S [Kiritimatiellia bacterium]